MIAQERGEGADAGRPVRALGRHRLRDVRGDEPLVAQTERRIVGVVAEGESLAQDMHRVLVRQCLEQHRQRLRRHSVPRRLLVSERVATREGVGDLERAAGAREQDEPVRQVVAGVCDVPGQPKAVRRDDYTAAAGELRHDAIDRLERIVGAPASKAERSATRWRVVGEPE